MQNKLKIVTIVGTRPEIIRLSRTMQLLDKYISQIVVHTGQNFDYELNEVFWNELELRKPDYFLEADRSSLGSTLGDIFKKIENVLHREKPDGILILGDTNSSLSAYIAKRMHIPIFHMEAGNRSFDQNVPEEINRKVVDHLSDFNLVYTEHARRNLLSEGISHRRIYLTGSPMKEVLDYYLPKINKSTVINDLGLHEKKYFLVSVHREENVDNEDNLKKILDTLDGIADKYELPVVVSTHPRTRNRLKRLNKQNSHELIQWMKPFGFIDYVSLQKNALCTISDSGTISEESSILSFPAVSVRQSMERPEAQDAGTIILTGLEKNIILNSIEVVISQFGEIKNYDTLPEEYTYNNTSWRVLKLILGNTKLSNKWWGIES